MIRLLSRDTRITVFVIIWTLLFWYQTLRAQYLSPLLRRELPAVPLLFPPAGWIMFYQVDRSYGFVEVYGLKNQQAALIEPHQIFATKAVGYDNIRRNVLVSVAFRQRGPAFCRYLRRKFPGYEDFAVVYAQYPDLVTAPDQLLRQVLYQCQ